MGRIENLGDYNTVRIALQNAGGNMDVLYEQIGEVAIAKATPKLVGQGAAAGLLVGAGLMFIGQKGYTFLKDRKKKIQREKELRNQFSEQIRCGDFLQNFRYVW